MMERRPFESSRAQSSVHFSLGNAILGTLRLAYCPCGKVECCSYYSTRTQCDAPLGIRVNQLGNIYSIRSCCVLSYKCSPKLDLWTWVFLPFTYHKNADFSCELLEACKANSDFQPTLVGGDGNAVQICGLNH